MKTGIITMFYKSSNYGGILQSYALVRVLRKMGIDAEQICYDLKSAYTKQRRIKMKVKKWILRIKEIKRFRLQIKIYKRDIIVWKAANKLVSHTRKAYSEKTIKSCIKNYNGFITGSDQVWSQNWPAYFLAFVPEGYKKIAYAVSVGNSDIPINEANYIKKYVQDYTLVSAREEETVEKLKKIISQPEPKMALDPTLLLEKEDWEAITSNRLISSNYLFCYFLGSDNRLRQIAKEYAKEKGLIILSIPHMQQKIESNDIRFADVELYSATPQDFLSCIKYSNMVFTDSFHASVFSLIYHKQFFAFSRTEYMKMGNRLKTLTSIFGTEDHYICDLDKYDLQVICSIKDIDYSRDSNEYLRRKKESLQLLQTGLLGNA